VLTFAAGMGESNAVTATSVLDGEVASYRITDSYSTDAAGQQMGSRIVAGAGCVSVDDTTVDCPAAGVSRIVLTGRDGDDTLDASAIAIPVTLSGGWGDDTLIGGEVGGRLNGGPGADRYFGGAGNDVIIARHRDADSAFDCGDGERDRVEADASPDDPVTAGANGCEVVNKQ
jgi:Ca2+-binding RTX toxin-like protein